MDNNILTDFFYGNINPFEKGFSHSSEYGKAAEAMVAEEEKLRGRLDEDGAALLNHLINLQGTLNGLTAEGYYIDGFRTGFQLAIALLDDGSGGQSFLYPVQKEDRKR